MEYDNRYTGERLPLPFFELLFGDGAARFYYVIAIINQGGTDGRSLVYADFLLSHCSVGMRNGMRGSVLGDENVHAKCDESADG